MATLPINLEVEDVAVGPVLVLLRKTPGVISIRLPFLEAKPTPAARPAGMNIEQTTVALFAKHHGGPLTLEQVREELGGAKTRSYGALRALKKKGILLQPDKGTYQFSARAMRMMQQNGEASGALPTRPLALPKAKTNGHKKTSGHKPAGGRAKMGVAPAALCEVLTENGPMKPIDIRTAIGTKGVSPTSLTGVLARGLRDGVVKKLAGGSYDLTAKGRNSADTSQSVGA